MNDHSPTVHASHSGYPCTAPKVVVVEGRWTGDFVVQHMGSSGATKVTEALDWFAEVLRAPIVARDTAWGSVGICDFSGVTEPGIYRVGLVDSGAVTFQFAIAETCHERLAAAFVDVVHAMRSGPVPDDEIGTRAPSHLDDGVRSDTGQPWDATGGWYDAGDLRKSVVQSTMPTLAFLETHARRHPRRRAFAPSDNDFADEARWGLEWIGRMQLGATEGAGRDGELLQSVGFGSKLDHLAHLDDWFENHYATNVSNSENHPTDNVLGSGDERTVAVGYQPIGQYVSIATWARAITALSADGRVPEWRDRASRAWSCAERHRDEPEEGRTVVRCWRLLAATQMARAGLVDASAADAAAAALLDEFDEDLSWWRFGAGDDEPYRGIRHAAQPVIALAEYAEPTGPAGAAERDNTTVLDDAPIWAAGVGDLAYAAQARAVLTRVLEGYVTPMVGQSAYGVMPYGLWRTPPSDGELYRPWRDDAGLVWRFFLPTQHWYPIDHGLSGHWASWAHAGAAAALATGDQRWRHLALRHLEWMTGANPLDVSLVQGFGWGTPMPHSRFLGTMPGAVLNGFNGTPDDRPRIGAEREAEWNTTEYWNVPLASLAHALALLLPAEYPLATRLGAVSRRD